MPSDTINPIEFRNAADTKLKNLRAGYPKSRERLASGLRIPLDCLDSGGTSVWIQGGQVSSTTGCVTLIVHLKFDPLYLRQPTPSGSKI